MAPRRIIADSDDEDDSLSPEPSPQKGPADLATLGLDPEKTQLNGSSSTDSHFFRSVYDQQQESLSVIASLQFLARAQEDSTRQSASKVESLDSTSDIAPAGPMQLPESQTKLARHSTTLATTHIRAQEREEQTSPAFDVWDVPSSAEQGVAGRSSLPATARPAKRIKTNVADRNIKSSTSGDSMKPTQVPNAPSIWIEPQTLSPSRRELYQSVQESSDEQNQSSSFAAHYHQTGIANMSSGSATIAYPTPTRAQGSAAVDNSHRADPSVDSPALRRQKRARAAMEAPGSSPDVLAVDDMGPLKVNGRQTGYTSDTNVEDIPEEKYQPRPSRRRAMAEGTVETGDATPRATDEGTRTQLAGSSGSLSARKQRGRPKKYEVRAPSDEPVEAVSLVEETVVSPAADVQPKKEKRKRGRPRKADKVAAALASADTPADDDAGLHAAKVPAQANGSPTDVDVVEMSTALDADAGDQPLQDKSIHGIASPQPRDDLLHEASSKKPDRLDPAEEEAALTEGRTKQKTSREHTVAQSTPGSKPLYRVGLSKRSRIAPLLKSLKKT